MEENIVFGRNAVQELLKSGNPVNKVLLKDEAKSGRNNDIIHLAKERGIPIQFVSRSVLDKLLAGETHQGVIAYIAQRGYAEPDELLEIARTRGEDPFILVLDEIEDPHNFGALLRTAEAAGVHGVIIPKRRSVGLTPIVAKTSAGAVEHIAVARVNNLVQTLNFLKEKGCWVTGAEADGKLVYEADLNGPRVLVIGSEGKGLGRLVKKNCDEIVSLPMMGKITSLNASAAGSVLMYEVRRQRLSFTKSQ